MRRSKILWGVIGGGASCLVLLYGTGATPFPSPRRATSVGVAPSPALAPANAAGRGSAASQGTAGRALEDPGPNLETRIETPADLRAFLAALERAGLEARGRLAECARRAEDPLIASHALRALGRVGAGSDPVVVERLDDERSAVRHAAIRALGVGGDASSAECLARLVRDDDVTVRHLAIDALGRPGGRRAHNVLEDLATGALEATDRAFVRAALASASLAPGS